jgi:hypothetical protein
MKKIILILVSISVLFLTGCNKDGQVNDFMKGFEKTTSEIAEKLNEDDIDGAKIILDEEKPDLRAKWLAISNIWSFQASDGIKKKMNTEPMENMSKMVEAANKAIDRYPYQKARIQAIVDDLTNVIK